MQAEVKMSNSSSGRELADVAANYIAVGEAPRLPRRRDNGLPVEDPQAFRIVGNALVASVVPELDVASAQAHQALEDRAPFEEILLKFQDYDFLCLSVESVNVWNLSEGRKMILEQSEISNHQFRLEETERQSFFRNQLELVSSLEQEALHLSQSSKVRGETMKYWELMSQFRVEERARCIQNAENELKLCQLLEDRLTVTLQNVKFFQKQYRVTCMALAQLPGTEPAKFSMERRRQQSQSLNDEAIARAMQEYEYDWGYL
jgi:hypothetical protein